MTQVPPIARPLGVLAALCFLAGCGADSGSDRVPPPVILISLDTVRADSLGAYGGPAGSTPVLDALCEEADRYETSISAAPWTMPSHASMFTGLYPFEHGAHSFLPEKGAKGDNVFSLSGRIETLAEALAGRGYQTAGIVSNAVYLRPMLGLEQGFATWDVERGSATRVNERAFEWLDKNTDGGRPTFMFLNYMDAHRPYFTGDRAEKPAQKLDQLILTVMQRGGEPGELGEVVHGLHQKAVTKLDGNLGLLFDGLKSRGLYDRAIIIVTSDHGEAFGAHGIVEHSKDVYEDTLRVPLIVKLPGQTEGRVVKGRASSVHVAGLIGAALAGTDAESLASVFRRVPSRLPEAVLAENYYSRLKDLKRFGERFRRRRWALYEGNLKLIAGSDDSVELYDVGVDPGELNNLAEGSPEDVARLMEKLHRKLNGATAYQGDKERPSAGLTPRVRSDMAALGYGEGKNDDEDEESGSEQQQESPR